MDPLGAIPLSGYSILRYLDTNKDFCYKAEKYGARTYYFMTDGREEMTKYVMSFIFCVILFHFQGSEM